MVVRCLLLVEIALAALLALGAAACGADTAGEADAGYEGDGGDTDGGTSPYDFDQPTAGLAVATVKSDGTTAAIYTLQGNPVALSEIVPDSAVPEGSGEHPVIVSLNRIKAHPMQTLVITAADLDTDAAAVSVVFEADGALPVAVPAIAVTLRTVEVAVPPLFDTSGANVAGRARVRVWEFTSSGYAASAFYDGVDVSELPSRPGLAPGAIVAAWLDAAVLDLDAVLAEPSANFPESYLATMTDLRASLSQLRANAILVSSDPSQPTNLPTTRGATLVLDAAALELADRLVLALAAALAESVAFERAPSWKSDERSIVQRSEACPMNSGDPSLDEFICSTRQENRAVLLGPPLLAAGYRMIVSSWLGFYGGFATIVFGTESAEAAVAFEVAWAAATGHIAAWASGGEPPTSGQTQADVGVVLVDRLAGTNGVLGGVYSSLMFGRELDAIVREGLPPIDVPDAGGDAGGDTGDYDVWDGGDDDLTGPDTGIGSVYEGTYVEQAPYDDGDCSATLTLTLYVTVAGLAGSGTPADPYRGDVDLFGTMAMNGCGGGTASIAPFEGRVGGSAGTVTFDAMGLVYASDLPVEFDGDLIGNELVGSMTAQMLPFGVVAASWEGPLTLERQ